MSASDPHEPALIADYVATCATLFSGIGGDALGLERAGYRPIWFSEILPYPSAVLAARWPEVPNLGDVTAIDWSTVERPRILAGGFPCQDISNAHTNGKRRALGGPRSGLWAEFKSAVAQLVPEWVIVENVAAQERWVPEVRADLAWLGYASLPVELSAGTFGAPHKRPRCFVVAHANGDCESLRSLDEEVARLRPLPRGGRDWRCPPPRGFRMADGVPNGVDRLHAVGNSVVPAAVEFIGRWIASSVGPVEPLPVTGSAPGPADTDGCDHCHHEVDHYAWCTQSDGADS